MNISDLLKCERCRHKPIKKEYLRRYLIREKAYLLCVPCSEEWYNIIQKCMIKFIKEGQYTIDEFMKD